MSKSFLTRQTWFWMLSQLEHHNESKMAILSHDILHSFLQWQMFKRLMLSATSTERKQKESSERPAPCLLSSEQASRVISQTPIL